MTCASRTSTRRRENRDEAPRTAPFSHAARALVRGLLAGCGGTVALTGYQSIIQQGEQEGPGEQAESEAERWQQAPAPAQVAKRILEGVFRADVATDRIPLLTNAMHWLYGTALGAVYGLVQGTIRANPLAHGLVFGGGVWGLSYLQLVPMGIYEPDCVVLAGRLDVDLGGALALIGRGCPPALAVRILA